MLGRRLVLGGCWAAALSSCSLGYDLIATANDSGTPQGFGGAAAGAPTVIPSSSSGGAAGSPSAGSTGGTATMGGQAALGGEGGEAPLDRPMIALSAGASHTCGLSSAGEVYCWGDNANLALGGFIGASSAIPQPVTGIGRSGEVVALSAGSGNACALTASGEVYCWGKNTFGSLGQGDTTDRDEPVLVPLPFRAIQVDLGYDTVCAIDEVDALHCWGANAEGQAGQNDTPQAAVPSLSPLEVPSTVGWREVSTGDGHVCAIRMDGQLHCWGRNTDDQLGQADPGQIRTPTQVGTEVDWAHVAVGQSQSCAIKNDRTLYCWGNNDESQLGIDPPGIISAPTQLGSAADWLAVAVDALHGCGLRDPGTLHCWGRRQEGQQTLPYDPLPTALPTRVGLEADWTDVTVGRFHTCARRAGNYQCTGENTDGRLGDGTMTRSYGWVSILAF
jgi:hypothetical protein